MYGVPSVSGQKYEENKIRFRIVLKLQEFLDIKLSKM